MHLLIIGAHLFLHTAASNFSEIPVLQVYQEQQMFFCAFCLSQQPFGIHLGIALFGVVVQSVNHFLKRQGVCLCVVVIAKGTTVLWELKLFSH